MTVGVLHPGAMGAALAGLLAASGVEVLWASEGRSADTARRATAAGLTDAGSLPALCARSDVVLCVCPPAAAADVADAVAGAGFTGTYVDANAVSPARMAAIAARLRASGARVVDGALLGPVPRRPGGTRLYLAGPGAGGVAALFPTDLLGVVVMPGEIGRASALKMAYAAGTKGADALTALGLALAERLGVGAELAGEWDRREPGRSAAARAELDRATPRTWRWVAEMEEVADTCEAEGLPGGFHRAAAELFGRWQELER